MFFPFLSLGEIFKNALMNTLLGMGTVFFVLIFISMIISLFAFIPKIQQSLAKKSLKDTKDINQTPISSADPVPEVVQTQEIDDLELVAVITAAIAASSGISEDDFVVRSIRRVRADKWNQTY